MISNILLTILDLFKYALFIRLIIDYVRIFARNWRPNSFLIAFFEMIYSITDPPMKFVEKTIIKFQVLTYSSATENYGSIDGVLVLN